MSMYYLHQMLLSVRDGIVNHIDGTTKSLSCRFVVLLDLVLLILDILIRWNIKDGRHVLLVGRTLIQRKCIFK